VTVVRLVFLGLLVACRPSAVPAPKSSSPANSEQPTAAALLFPEEAEQRGLTYVNRSGEAAKATVLEANGAGVALLDLEADGDLDVFFGQGLPSLAQAVSGPGADLEGFRNAGGGRFTRAGAPGISGWWTGFAVGDLNSDGRDDLIASGYGGLEALLQTEAGELAPLADAGLFPSDAPPGAKLVPGAARSVGQIPWWATSIAVADFNLDGVLDLYVGQYLELDPLAPPLGQLGSGALSLPCVWKGHPVFCGPRGMQAQPDRLLLGLGDGRFRPAEPGQLPEEQPAYTLGVAPFDADNDGDTDVYVANDSVANRLWINDSRANFVDHALAAGVALNQDGMAEAGMGVAVADVDRDGRFDLCVTNFSDEPTQLFLGAKVGFRTATYQIGLGAETKRLLSWGVHLSDFDGDGWQELFCANGHVYPQADLPGTGTRYGQAASLFRLWPKARVERLLPGGPGSLLAAEIGARGSAVGDLNGDGAPDLVLARIDAPAALGINNLNPKARRLLVQLRGPSAPGPGPRQTSRSAHGARLIAVPRFPPSTPAAEEFALLAEVQTGGSFQSASSAWVHFGLGKIERLAQLEVIWPSGAVERYEDVAAGRRLVIEEGRGIVAEEPFTP
jgi:enediyne biosynthesis protein E4